MKRTFGWLGITTATLLICLEAASFATDTQYSQSTVSVPSVELLAQRRPNRRPPRNLQGFRVPIRERVGGIPVIAVTFNGNQTFPILMDTGASITIITPEMARAAGFKREGTEKIRVGDGDIVDMPRGSVPSMSVGEAEFNDFTVLVGPTPLLGQNFFSEYNVTIAKDFVVFRERRR